MSDKKTIIVDRVETRKDRKGCTWDTVKGPWNNEPDRVEFLASGFDCMIQRNMQNGSWCGYVAVPKDHKAYEKGYDTVDVSVHGGLTYADHCNGHICHKPLPGRPDDVWWLGFDCAHGEDVIPMFVYHAKHDAPYLSSFIGKYGEAYKDTNYAMAETMSLARQLARMK